MSEPERKGGEIPTGVKDGAEKTRDEASVSILSLLSVSTLSDDLADRHPKCGGKAGVQLGAYSGEAGWYPTRRRCAERWLFRAVSSAADALHT